MSTPAVSKPRPPAEPPAPLKVTTEVETITPEKAREYLKLNLDNRNLRATKVNAYAVDMVEGRWKNTGQGIIFGTDGTMYDGQHRCAAIVKSGVTVEMNVTRNVSPEAKFMIDVGNRRTTADALKIMGHANVTVGAAIARLGLIYDRQNYSSKSIGAISTPMVTEYYMENQHEIDLAAHRATVMVGKVAATQSVTGAAFFLFHRVNAEECEQFFNAIINLRTDGEGDPRLALVRRLQSISTERTRANQLQKLDLFIRAWNAHREQRQMTTIPMATTPTWRKII